MVILSKWEYWNLNLNVYRRNILTRNKFIVIALLVVLTCNISVFAKPRKRAAAAAPTPTVTVRIDQPITKNYPKMEVYVSVVDQNHEPVLSLIRGNFGVFVDGFEVQDKIDVAGFQYTEDGIAYSLIIAGNGMMEGEPMEQQLKSAVVLFESMREQDRLSIYVFGEEVKTVFEFQKKDESLLDSITKIQPLGGNPHLNDAIVYVTRRFEKTDTKRKVIVVFSDGRESGSRYNQEQLYKIVDEANIPVYSAGMKIMSGQNLYRIAEISQHTGGDYIYCNSLSSASNAMELITKQVLLGYKLMFNVSHLKADNQLHQLHIRAVVKDKDTSFFKNFIATKKPIVVWVIVLFSILALLLVILLVVLMIIRVKKFRKEMGISNRKCPVCKKRMKDDWDECMFCKYDKPKKKKKLL